MLSINLEIRQVYGRTLFYPVNDTAKKCCKLLGVKTLTLDQVNQLKDMGLEVVASYPDLTKGSL